MTTNPYTTGINAFISVYEPLLDASEKRTLTQPELDSIKEAFYNMGWKLGLLMADVDQIDAERTTRSDYTKATPEQRKARMKEVRIQKGWKEMPDNEEAYAVSQKQYGKVRAKFLYSNSSGWTLLDLEYPRDFIKSLARIAAVQVPTFKEPSANEEDWQSSDSMKEDQRDSYIAAVANEALSRRMRERENETPWECYSRDSDQAASRGTGGMMLSPYTMLPNPTDAEPDVRPGFTGGGGGFGGFGGFGGIGSISDFDSFD